MSMVSPDPAKMPESTYLGYPIDQAPKLVATANPATYTGESMALILVQHGTADRLVPWAQSEEFVAAVKAQPRPMS